MPFRKCSFFYNPKLGMIMPVTVSLKLNFLNTQNQVRYQVFDRLLLMMSFEFKAQFPERSGPGKISSFQLTVVDVIVAKSSIQWINALLSDIDKKLHEDAHNLLKITGQGKIVPTTCLNISSLSSISDSIFTRNHNMLDCGRACITTCEKKYVISFPDF